MTTVCTAFASGASACMPCTCRRTGLPCTDRRPRQTDRKKEQMTMCAINQPQLDKTYFTLTAQSCMGASELVPTTENGCVPAKQEFDRKLALLIRLDDVMADLNGRIAWP